MSAFIDEIHTVYMITYQYYKHKYGQNTYLSSPK